MRGERQVISRARQYAKELQAGKPCMKVSLMANYPVQYLCFTSQELG